MPQCFEEWRVGRERWAGDGVVVVRRGRRRRGRRR